MRIFTVILEEITAVMDLYLETFQGKTKVKKDSSNPDWSQQIIFTELFPPLVRTMRIHVRDNNGTVIATTFLDLNVVADNSTEGTQYGPPCRSSISFVETE